MGDIILSPNRFLSENDGRPTPVRYLPLQQASGGETLRRDRIALRILLPELDAVSVVVGATRRRDDYHYLPAVLVERLCGAGGILERVVSRAEALAGLGETGGFTIV
jgi:hypothetical protein